MAADEEHANYDTDTDDDTTPLVNPTNQNQNNGGGTFADDQEASSLSTAARLRNLREVARSFLLTRHPTFATADNHSINGETSIEVSTSSSDTYDTVTSTTTTTTAEGNNRDQPCSDDEVHVHTRPEEGSGDRSNDVII